LDDLIVGAYFTNSSAGKSYVVFGKADSSAIDLSVIADANNPLGGFVINGQPLASPAASPLITKPPKGLLASAIALRLIAPLLALPNTT
jgi:hypothetical protein